MPESKKRKGRKSAKRKPRTPKEDAAQQASAAIKGGAVVTLVEVEPGAQVFQFSPVEGTTMREIPTLLRQAAANLEKQLVEG